MRAAQMTGVARPDMLGSIVTVAFRVAIRKKGQRGSFKRLGVIGRVLETDQGEGHGNQ